MSICLCKRWLRNSKDEQLRVGSKVWQKLRMHRGRDADELISQFYQQNFSKQ
ncbi:4617_t:CDS:2 [Dentiscutata heterogama]|uniref:4617_t:CDS:1 n=1 Tax=Dentiscutata heterogama TaxID=1316150 RepID=A0ACA9MWW7_9GLOM|nr:4617_t:CDS:2 [Dentiscutata heterogama]